MLLKASYQQPKVNDFSVDEPRSIMRNTITIKRKIRGNYLYFASSFFSAASNKKFQRLKLSICPRGIETFDSVTGETLHRVSIYKISYCSADAAHNNVFAFIAGTANANTNNDIDELTCYAFLCAKRKIAFNLTITVAKNFERAYDLWKQSQQRKTEQCTFQRLDTNTLQINATPSNQPNRTQNNSHKNLLIDFNSDSIDITPDECQQQSLHTAWVSFDDEPLMNNNTDSQPMPSKTFENNLWDMNVNLICH